MYKGLVSVLILEAMMNNEHRRYVRIRPKEDADYTICADELDSMPLFEQYAPVENVPHQNELESAFQVALEMHWNAADCTVENLRKQSFSAPMAQRLAAIA